MFTDLQRAELRLRMIRERGEALVEELTQAEQQAEELIRRSGRRPDDLRIEISRRAMRDAVAEASRKLDRVSELLNQVEGGRISPIEIDLDALENQQSDGGNDSDRPRDIGQGPQFP